MVICDINRYFQTFRVLNIHHSKSKCGEKERQQTDLERKLRRTVSRKNRMDASVMDPAGGRNQTDMVTYTLADYERIIRYLPDTWQAFGSVPNLTSLEH